MTIVLPDRFLLYYAWPSLVNGAGGSLSAAVDEFKVYDRVVFGAGIEQSSHPENTFLTALIPLLQAEGTECYGYVRMGQLGGGESTTAINARATLWDGMGADGIFLDEFGYDFGVHRDDQVTVMTHIHGLTNANSVWANAFDPDDCFNNATVALNAFGGGNPTPTNHVFTSGDRYLYESYRIRNQLFEPTASWQAKTVKIRTAQAAVSGLKIDCVSTDDHPSGATDVQPPLPYGTWTKDRWRYVYYNVLVDDFDGASWGFPAFSASGAWNTIAPWFDTPPTVDAMAGDTWTTSQPLTVQNSDTGAFTPYIIRSTTPGLYSLTIGLGPPDNRYVEVNW